MRQELGRRPSVTVSTRAPGDPEFGTRVDIAPGVAGLYATGQPVSSPSLITWSDNGLFYTIYDSHSLLTREELVAMAGNLVAGP